jgi:glycosyltransferase involved in cell wall biosynthesis
VRALLLADMCNPEWASVPRFGHALAKAIVDRVDEATVVTNVHNRAALETSGIGDARLEFVDTALLARPLEKASLLLRGGRTLGWSTLTAFSYPSYLAFEWLAWRRTRADLATGRYDVVHRVTPLSPSLPSPMATWSPVPFVIGPVNGGLPWPAAFRGYQLREREWLRWSRALRRWLPYYASGYRGASAILAGFSHTSEGLPRAVRDRTLHFSDVGFDPEVFRPPADRRPGARVSVLFAGRLVPGKCADVLLDAFAGSALLRQQRLLIAGAGPERERMDRLIHEHGLSGTVTMLGWVRDMARLMRETEVFAFPSVHELGGGVVLEAMASGMACVVVDHGGPRHYVAPGCGVKIRCGTRGELVESYRRELEGLVRDVDRRRRISVAAHRHVSSRYSWAAKAGQVALVYEWVTGRRSRRPPVDLVDADLGADAGGSET